MKNNTNLFSTIIRGEAMRELTLLLLFPIILSLTACTTLAASQTTPTPQPSNTLTITPTIITTSEPTLTPSATPLTGGTLNQEGPWLMYEHMDGTLYFVNSDGTGRTQSAIKIGKDDYVTTSPDGDVVAIGDFELTNGKLSIYLDIFKLPEITQLQHLDLYSYLLQHPQDDIQKSIPGWENILWSPDGRYLAFIAVMDGPSSDLYAYDTKTNQIKRLTSSEHQVGDMFWSPDSKWIVHEEIMGGIGCYAYNLWTASPDGSEVKWLYQPERHICLSLRGWLDESRFVTYGHPIEGMGFIRETNLNTNESTLLYSSIFPFSGPFLDRENEVLAFYSNKDERNHIEEEGIYILPVNNPTPLHISIEKQNLNYDYEQNFFYVSIKCSDENGIEGYWGFKSDGITYCTHPTSYPNGSISPDQKWIFPYHTNELCSYPEQECIFTYGDGNSRAVWRPDSQGFFVFTRETLHYIPLDTLTPILVDDQLNSVVGEHGIISRQWIGE